MGTKTKSSPSGVYLGRKCSVLLALLAAALLLALVVLAALYGRCSRRRSDDERPGSPTTTTAPAGRPPGPWDDFRLPATLRPLHYSLLLWPHTAAPGQAAEPEPEPEPRTFSGQVAITVRCLGDTPVVLLHSHTLTYQGAAVLGPLGEEEPRRRRVPVAQVWLAERHQYVVLELREELRAGALYELRLDFEGRLRSFPDFHGLFLSTYRDEGESR